LIIVREHFSDLFNKKNRVQGILFKKNLMCTRRFLPVLIGSFVILLISGSLIAGISTSSFASKSTKGIETSFPSNETDTTGTSDEVNENGIESSSPSDETGTSDNDNESTSAMIVAPQDRYCLEGTGGNTGKACIRCDPGLTFEVGCIDVSTGGPLDMGQSATSDTGTSKGKGQFMTPEIAEMLQSTNNTADRPKIIFGNLKEQLLSGDSEESTKALGTLCIMASADNSSKIDCSKPVECGPLCGAALGWLVGKVADSLSKKEGNPTGCHTYLPPIYCKLQ
jgi:hypothetical protein